MRRYPTDHQNPRRLRYGWRLAQSGHIMIDAHQRACIYQILRLRRKAFTLQQICNTLAEQQYQPPRRAAWYCTTVRKIIEQNESLGELLARMDERLAMHLAAESMTVAPLIHLPRRAHNASPRSPVHQGRR